MSQRHSPPPHLATSRFPAPATSTPQNPHKVLRLPRKVAISYHVSHTFGIISTRSEHPPIHENRPNVTATSNTPKTPPSNLNANPNLTAQNTADLTKCCACAVNSSSQIQRPKTTVLICDDSDDRPPSKNLSKSFAQWGQISDDARTTDDDKEHAR